ncbi:MAG: asparagine synthase-related protein [Candidatus Acidiferrales bacterium]
MPVDRALLGALTDFMSYAAPDDLDTYSDGPVGLGHALLQTTRESFLERMPVSLDGKFWITADARIDCREELRGEIEKAESNRRPAASDSELILHAYAVWGQECVRHLRGDFAFAIWDARRKTLFCARDHFGIKPFYYAEIGSLFLFSNVLNCVRSHPEISDSLNDAAIGDFLLFGLNCDLSTTTFRDIQRLPPAHCLSVTAEGVRILRYWSAPTSGAIRYRHADEYVEHFQTLIQSSVADRLRADCAGILLSGGLDSGAIAATATELSRSPLGARDLRAYTVINKLLISDRDGAYAQQVADHLRIPIQFLEMSELEPFERWNDSQSISPEPVGDPLFAGLSEEFKRIAADCRVVLCGEGPDNLMYFEMLPFAKQLLRERDLSGLVREVSGYFRARSTIWPGIRRRIKGIFGKDPNRSLFPSWLDADFSRRLNLNERWKEWSELPASRPHPVLPKAHVSLQIPQWTNTFEQESPGASRYPVEVRYPFLDLRIVNFLLALPPFPFFFEKKLLRDAMVGRLPENVRLRPKTPLAGDPLSQSLQKNVTTTERWNQVHWSMDMERYVNRSALVPVHDSSDPEQISVNVRPLCLNFWLRSARPVLYNLRAEVRNA